MIDDNDIDGAGIDGADYVEYETGKFAVCVCIKGV
jgi:hypothetical protein